MATTDLAPRTTWEGTTGAFYLLAFQVAGP